MQFNASKSCLNGYQKTWNFYYSNIAPAESYISKYYNLLQ